jgi:type II secretory pathway pseudopilin PulG
VERFGRLDAPPRHQRRPGFVPAFTLIEVLLALLLLAVVVTLTYAAMFQITSGAKLLTDEFTEDQELRLLVRMMSQDLGAVTYAKAYVTASPASGPKRSSGLDARIAATEGGEFSAVDFHAAVRSRQNRQAPASGDPGLHEIGYSVKQDFTTHALQLVRREDYYIDDQIELGGVSTVLASDVETFKVECLTPPASPTQTQEVWTQEWNSSTQPPGAELPGAIRITLGVAGKNGRHLKQVVEINLLAGLIDTSSNSPSSSSSAGSTSTPNTSPISIPK